MRVVAEACAICGWAGGCACLCCGSALPTLRDPASRCLLARFPCAFFSQMLFGMVTRNEKKEKVTSSRQLH
eukprot:1160300-Pelagomonas_calceolata.AAC.15